MQADRFQGAAGEPQFRRNARTPASSRRRPRGAKLTALVEPSTGGSVIHAGSKAAPSCTQDPRSPNKSGQRRDSHVGLTRRHDPSTLTRYDGKGQVGSLTPLRLARAGHEHARWPCTYRRDHRDNPNRSGRNPKKNHADERLTLDQKRHVRQCSNPL